MRIVKLDKYNPNAQPISVQAKVWQILWLALNDYPAGNREQTLVGNRVFNEIREASEIAYETDAKDNKREIGRRLKPSGVELYFDDAEFRLLGQAVDKFRVNVTLPGSDALLWIDQLLEKAPEVSKKDYIAKVKKLKLEPADAES